MPVVSVVRTHSVWMSFIAARVAGFVVGVVAKFADESSIANRLGANDLFTLLGLWVVLVTVLSAWSRSRSRAMLRVVTFLFAMVTAYYLVTWLLFGVLPLWYVLSWAGVALAFAPLFALVTWHAKRDGWLAAFGAALPIGLLLWEAYSLRLSVLLHGLHITQVVFDLVAATVLFMALPTDSTQRLRVLPLTFLTMYVAGIAFNHILPRVLGVL